MLIQRLHTNEQYPHYSERSFQIAPGSYQGDPGHGL